MKLFGKKKGEQKLNDSHPGIASLLEAASIEEVDAKDDSITFNSEQLDAIEAAIVDANSQLEKLEGENAKLTARNKEVEGQLKSQEELTKEKEALEASMTQLNANIAEAYKALDPKGEKKEAAEQIAEMQSIAEEYGKKSGAIKTEKAKEHDEEAEGPEYDSDDKPWNRQIDQKASKASGRKWGLNTNHNSKPEKTEQ